MRKIVLGLLLFVLSIGVVGAQSPPQPQLAIPGVIAADARVELVRDGDVCDSLASSAGWRMAVSSGRKPPADGSWP